MAIKYLITPIGTVWQEQIFAIIMKIVICQIIDSSDDRAQSTFWWEYNICHVFCHHRLLFVWLSLLCWFFLQSEIEKLFSWVGRSSSSAFDRYHILGSSDLRSFSWKRFPLPLWLDGTWWGLTTIPKYFITFCELGCEQWYSSIDLSCEQWLQHRLLSCGTGNTKHFSLVPQHRHQG